MENFRLDSVAPSVAEHFRVASHSKRRQAVLLACEYAAKVVGLSMEEARLALVKLREGTSDPSLGSQLASLASRHDDEYLHLAEAGESDDARSALRYFSLARAMTALSFALSSDENDLHEAIYEAMAALDEPNELTRIVDAALA